MATEAEPLLVTFQGVEMTPEALLIEAERLQKWCAVCLGGDVAKLGGAEV